ncbi:MAG: hypothetical protein HYZ74_06010 [Elusimicrobia bacterium]|nr:hypothetical protein [Elusimicrobiota bacterium]
MMSLKHFHRFFLVLCLALFAFLSLWAFGRNPAGLVTPWLAGASLTGAAATAAYLFWHLRTVRLPE